MSLCYLIHFDKKYEHSQHYIGYAENLKARMDHHRKGSGARLMQVIQQAGITWSVVRVWEGEGKTFERRLKNCKNAARFCPVCNPNGWNHHAPETATASDRNCNKEIPF